MARVWLCDMARSQKGPEKLWLAAKPAEEIKQLREYTSPDTSTSLKTRSSTTVMFDKTISFALGIPLSKT